MKRKFFAGMLLLMLLVAGCRKNDGPAISGEELERACERISCQVTEVAEGSMTGTRVYTVTVTNDSDYDLVKGNLSVTYQVLIEEKEVQYSGGEAYPAGSEFDLPAGERKEYLLEVPVYDASSMEGEQFLLKMKGYLNEERPEHTVLIADTQILDAGERQE